MELGKKLLEQGWHITEEGIKKVIAAASNEDGTEVNDVRKVISTIMNIDFREIAGGALPSKRDDNIPGRIVLQLQKTRNISAPKSNEESKTAPRFLQLELTDGQTTIHALELENISALSMNLPPGTKIYFRSERLQLMQSFLILRSSELQVLGGRVEAMAEKWELARTMLKYAKSGRRMSGVNGPPPWIPFGKKVENSLTNDRNFKSLQAVGSDGKETKENEEFNAMRNEAIAEASKTGSKKVFGGGGQQMLDHNVKKILEKGFSEEDAKQALRTTNNNLERALYNLKRRGEIKRAEENVNGNFKNTQSSTFMTAKSNRGVPTREVGSGKRGGPPAKEEVVAKPAGNVSLFDFLTDKLPVDAGLINHATNLTSSTNISEDSSRSNKFEKIRKETSKPSNSEKKTSLDSAVNSNSNAIRPRFENTMSSSFAANRSVGPVNVRQRSERGNTNIKGGRNSNERVKSTSIYNPFKDPPNDRPNEVIRSSGGLPSVNNQNANQGRNNRVSYERGKIINSSGGDSLESGKGNSANKRGNEKQQQRNHGGTERIGGHNDQRNRFVNKRENINQPQNNNSDGKNGGTTKSTATQNSNASNACQMNKLIEDTSKLKISDPGRSPETSSNTTVEFRSNLQQSPSASQNFGSSQQTNQLQSSTQANNGYSYDTSKIIGFQNKKTNEFAMTLLKSQGLGASKSALGTQQQQQPLSTQLQAPSQMNTYVTPTSDYSVPTPQTVSVPIPSHFGMVQGDGWHWKVGDLCFAKYWDDGRYYEAEVTAVSEKTCVVFFLGYGNHEEVLKSDCLPITDGNHCPVNNYNCSIPYQQSPQEQSHAISPINSSQQMQQGAYQRGGGGSQRFRSERQMYVPPHKREN
ncbi:tudor domain-containing protein 3 [Zeugodacus cucurbitae]|uniref:Survival of motor neuron-related-splicing factor 30 n=1 Tax=Zeugodacus cucurbitae TaxID=28588 RepID=A0A0A1WKM4_ZEUCU|nr:tudor domain-containing protein 3 [Zeugodacus cucurbitae]